METRELRYFVAVAEELHFGRAALDAIDAAERRTRRAALAPTGRPGVVLR